LIAKVTSQIDIESDPPLIVFPSPLSLAADTDLQSVHNLSDTIKVDELIATLSTHNVETNVESLVKLRTLDPLSNAHHHWMIPVIVSTTLVLLAVVLYFCLKTHGVTLLKCNTRNASASQPASSNHIKSQVSLDQPSTACGPLQATTTRYSTYAMDQLSTA
jgi:hypothetical protein